MSELRRLVDRQRQAFNARDFVAWRESFAEDVEFLADGVALHGVEAVLAYTAGVVREFPGIRIANDRVILEGGDTLVVEADIVDAGRAAPGDASYSLEGTLCELWRMAGGRIVACHSYYAVDDVDGAERASVRSRAASARVAAEQAALRRVATLVAKGVSADRLFAAVNEEIGRLVGADPTAMARFEPDGAVTLVAGWSSGKARFPIGVPRPLDPLLREVRETGRPARFVAAELPPAGSFVEEVRQLGIHSAVGVPIAVEGRVWGMTFACTTQPEPFPDETEQRIAAFTELVGTAISNAQARSELRMLVEEQRALRRVATLVARDAAPPDVLGAVAVEASRLLGGKSTALLRYDPDGEATMVAVSGAPGEVGMRVPATGESITARVSRTGRAARLDSYDGVAGGDLARDLGVQASVGAPIAVAGRLWGLIMALSLDEPLPAAAEDRLAQFAELVGAAIGNAATRAELTASRARVVATADEHRRRIQQDVHDGAQQRLVHTVLTLKLAEDALGPDAGPAAELVAEALENAQRATAELRELVHGVLPAALARGGLRAGVESLVGGMTLPVSVDVPDDRLPAALEMTAYFIVAEALSNVVKHAGAGSAQIRAVVDGDALRLEVRDDGRGGADPMRGSGLVGLTDRVGAMGGTIAIASPPGAGTTLAVELPM